FGSLGPRRLDVEHEALAVGVLGLVAEDGILPGLEGGDQAHALAVLRYVADIGLAGALGTGVAAKGNRRALDPDLPEQRGAHAADRLQQLRLAVAGDAGDADDLAGAHGE